MGTEHQRPTRKIGKYEILAELGKGAMGVVYKAQDPFLGRFVAIKTMSSTLMDDPDLLQRFYREAQSAGNLRHANIVTIYDLGEENGVPYIAMEFLEGHDLEELIRVHTPYNIFKKLNIIVQICRGLDYAHKHGIVHRDVKPANVRILADGDVKIVDFGIARITGSNITRPDLVMGTVNYMSPEQIQTPKDIDRRSDLFSVGVIMYEFLTYQKPFTGDTIPTILFKIINEPITPISKFLPNCPKGISDVVDRAMAKNPNQRFKTCEDMAQEIENVMESLKPQVIQELLETGHRQLQSNDFLSAQKQYYEVLEIDGSHKIAKTILRRIEEEQKKYFQDQQAKTLVQQGTQLVRQSEFDEAVKCYQEALQLTPQNADIKRLINEALEKKAYVAKRQEFEAVYNEANRLSLDGQLEPALTAVDRALKIFPADPEGLGLRRSIQDELTLRERRSKVGELLSQARDVLIHKDYDEAHRLLQQGLQADPGNRECTELLEYARREQQEEEKRKILEERLAKAKSEISGRQYENALKTLREASEINPADPRIERLASMARAEVDEEGRRQFRNEKIREAKSLLAERQYDAAMAALEAAQKQAPKDPEVLRLMAMARQEQTQVEQEQFLGQELTKARALMQQHRYSDAASVLTPLAKQFPDHLEVRKNLERAQSEGEAEEKRASRDILVQNARQRIEEHRFDEALKTLSAARQEHPNDPEIQRLIQFAQTEKEILERSGRLKQLREEAKEFLAQKRYDDARQSLVRAREIDPEDPEIQRIGKLIDQQAAIEVRKAAVGLVVGTAKDLLKAKKYHEATETLQKALEKYPQDFELETLLKLAREEEEQAKRRAFVSEQINRVTESVNRQDFAGAVKLLREALQQYPKERELTTLLSQVEERKTQQEHIATLKRQLEETSLLIEKEKFDDAIRALQDLRKSRPADASLIDVYLRRAEESREAQKAAAERTVAAPLAIEIPVMPGKAPAAKTAAVPVKKPFPMALVGIAAGVVLLAVIGYFVFSGMAGAGEFAVLTDPGDATVMLNDKSMGSATGGRLQLKDIAPGAYTIVAHKDGYGDVRQQITVAKGKNADVTLKLAPAAAALRVRAGQQGVRIQVQGKDAGMTGSDGTTTIQNVPAGRQTVTLFKEGMAEVKKDVEFTAGQTAEIDETLMPLPVDATTATLRVATDPPDAYVLLDGRNVGPTTGGSLTVQDLKPGRVKLVVKKEGYLDVEQSLSLTAGKIMDRSFTLSGKPATLQLTTNVPEATVKIDDKPVGKTDSSGKLEVKNIASKRQAVEVQKDGYESKFEFVEFKAADTAQINWNLTRRSAVATSAGLTVSSAPSEADVYLDDKPVARTPTASIAVPPGRHKITVKKDKYRDAERTVEFRVGEPQALPFTLEKARGILEVTGQPDGVIATINGVAHDTATSRQIELEPGSYTVQISKAGYANKQEAVTIRDQQTVPLRVSLDKSAVEVVKGPPPGPVTPTVTLAGAYQDSFVTLDEWEAAPGWAADQGLMHAKGVGVTLLKDRIYKNFSAKFQLHLANGVSGSWIVRAQDAQNYYLIQINGEKHPRNNLRNTIFCYVYKNGKSAPLGNFPLPFSVGKDPNKKPPEWMDVTVVVSGNRISVRAGGTVLTGTKLTDKELGQFEDPANTFPTGKFGFQVAGGEDFEVTSLLVEPIG